MADLNLNDFSGIVGDPYNPYQQAYSDTCAIKSQQLILNDFGINVTEDQLVQYSAEHGWYHGEGTAMGDIGNLLADAGIPCTQTIDANVYDLANQLAQGHKVIVAVDSSELWEGGFLEWLKELFFGEQPDHALIVAGIDLTDPDNPLVILTDPGTGQAAQPYPLDQFMDAWGDSHNFMVSTDVPTPTSFDAFMNAGMTDMHLPEVAGVDYSTFQDFQTLSHMIEPTLLPDLNLAFQAYPTIPDVNFNNLLIDYGIPTFDMSLFQPAPLMYDPFTFDYTGLNDMSWLNDLDTFTATDHEIDMEAYNKLTELHQDALDHAQQCLDNGMYISAEMWQANARDIQHNIDTL